MRLALVALALLALAASSVSAQCFTKSCGSGGLGSACNTFCNSTSCVNQCTPPYLCAAMPGQAPACVDSLVGMNCNTNSDCLPSTYSTSLFGSTTDPNGQVIVNNYYPALSCTVGKCATVLNLKVPGDGCLANNECSSRDCAHGVCAGAPSSFPCSSNSECAPHLRCAGGRCSEFNLEGELCSSSANCFSRNMVCQIVTGGTGFCLYRARQPQDQRCYSSARCGSNMLCSNVPTVSGGPSSFSTCQTLASNSAQTARVDTFCNGTLTCPDMLSCGCSTNSASNLCYPLLGKTTQDCTTLFVDYNTCLDGKGCHRDSPVNQKGSCAYECRGQYIRYMNCKGASLDGLANSNCAFRAVDAPSPASALHASVLSFF